MTEIGFVGSGRIARIMLQGWRRAEALPKGVKVFDTNAGLAERLASEFASTSAASLEEVARQDIVVVGLHPPVVAEVLPGISKELRPGAIVLSLAPKVRFGKMRELLGGFGRLARQNPNAPSIINCGYNPIAFADTLDAPGRDVLRALLAPLGATPEVAEDTIEAYALISAMGPTYLWFQFDLLRRMAVEFGLSEPAAREAVAAMVHGATAALFESGLSVEQVLDLVPVKPLAADEAAIADLYRGRLLPLYAKLTS